MISDRAGKKRLLQGIGVIDDAPGIPDGGQHTCEHDNENTNYLILILIYWHHCLQLGACGTYHNFMQLTCYVLVGHVTIPIHCQSGTKPRGSMMELMPLEELPKG